MKAKIEFKRCSKSEWKEEPNYIVKKNGSVFGFIFFFDGDSKPSFELDNSGCFDRVFGINEIEELPKIFSAIHEKMKEFEIEVKNEG